ncbi:hypothetical protein Tco_0763610 [Tanacetum coccineum]
MLLEMLKLHGKMNTKIHSDVTCLMLGKMSPALQRQFELYFPQAMLNELRKMFEKPQAVEIYDLVDTLHSCKQAPGKSKGKSKEGSSLSPLQHSLVTEEELPSLPQRTLRTNKNRWSEHGLMLLQILLWEMEHIAAVERHRVFNFVLPSGIEIFLKRDLISQEFRSERNKSAPNHLNLNIEVEDDVVTDLREPANYKAAMLDPDKVIWQGAMDEEMNSMKVNEQDVGVAQNWSVDIKEYREALLVSEGYVLCLSSVEQVDRKSKKQTTICNVCNTRTNAVSDVLWKLFGLGHLLVDLGVMAFNKKAY